MGKALFVHTSHRLLQNRSRLQQHRDRKISISVQKCNWLLQVAAQCEPALNQKRFSSIFGNWRCSRISFVQIEDMRDDCCCQSPATPWRYDAADFVRSTPDNESDTISRASLRIPTCLNLNVICNTKMPHKHLIILPKWHFVKNRLQEQMCIFVTENFVDFQNH